MTTQRLFSVAAVFLLIWAACSIYMAGYEEGMRHANFMSDSRYVLERKPCKSEAPPGITVRNSYCEASSDISKIVIGAETLEDVARVYAVLRAGVQNDPEMDQACKAEVLRQIDKSQQFQLEHVKVTK